MHTQSQISLCCDRITSFHDATIVSRSLKTGWITVECLPFEQLIITLLMATARDYITWTICHQRKLDMSGFTRPELSFEPYSAAILIAIQDGTQGMNRSFLNHLI